MEGSLQEEAIQWRWERVAAKDMFAHHAVRHWWAHNLLDG